MEEIRKEPVILPMYVDMNNGGIYYFDSYGIEPPKEIKVLMNRLTNQGKNFNSSMRKYVNNMNSYTSSK